MENDGVINLRGTGPGVTVGDGNFELADETSDTTQIRESTLTVRNGGELRIDDMTDRNGNLRIGDDEPGQGRVQVTGQDSHIHISGMTPSLDVGRAGTGTLLVEDGASVNVEMEQTERFPIMDIGDRETGDGSVTVSGQNSAIRLTGGKWGVTNVGKAGEGNLAIENSGLFETGAMRVGFEQGAHGEVVVRGEQSLLRAGVRDDSPEFLIGARFNPNGNGLIAGGEGTVSVRDGGQIRAGRNENDGRDDIIVGPNGTLEVNNASNDGVEAVIGDVRVMEGGTFSPGNSPGEAAIKGDFEASSSVTMEINGAEADLFDVLDVSGVARLKGGLDIRIGDSAGLAPGDSLALVEAEEGVFLPDEAEISVDGLDDDSALDVTVGENSLTVTVVGQSDEIA